VHERDHPRPHARGRPVRRSGRRHRPADKLWGNYRLTYEVRLGARILTHPFFAGEASTGGFAAAIEEAPAGARR
jgi:hypothetical protein